MRTLAQTNSNKGSLVVTTAPYIPLRTPSGPGLSKKGNRGKKKYWIFGNLPGHFVSNLVNKYMTLSLDDT